MAATKPSRKWTPIRFGGILDESTTPSAVAGLTAFQNGVYRRFGSWGKRAGSGPYAGTGGIIGANPVRSGVRWYRGVPSATRTMIAQSGDNLYTGNDGTGAVTLLTSLTASSTPAFYASCYDPAESGVGGTPASDILVVAYGSGAPIKYDGTNVTQLNSSITNHFTGVTFFHEHLALWGDPNYPDTVFFTDLGNPESYAFSSAFGGYPIGRGDGDPNVQCCVPVGNVLYVFKSNSIYAITGYDFLTGEYQFSVQPVVVGSGIPNPYCVTVLNSALIYWDGQGFRRLALGSFTPENIGRPIPATSSLVALGNQSLMRATAGNFGVAALVGGNTYQNVAMFAVDVGNGVADTVLVYDDDASNKIGDYAWSMWNGFSVGAWIPWQGAGDRKLLYFGDAAAGQIYEYGVNATADVRMVSGTPTSTAISWSATTGALDCGTPDLQKLLHHIYLQLWSNAANFTIQAQSDIAAQSAGLNAGQGVTSGWVLGTSQLGINTFLTAASGQIYQDARATINPSVRGHNFTITITEASTTASYEIVGTTLDMIEEAYLP